MNRNHAAVVASTALVAVTGVAFTAPGSTLDGDGLRSVAHRIVAIPAVVGGGALLCNDIPRYRALGKEMDDLAGISSLWSLFVTGGGSSVPLVDALYDAYLLKDLEERTRRFERLGVVLNLSLERAPQIMPRLAEIVKERFALAKRILASLLAVGSGMAIGVADRTTLYEQRAERSLGWAVMGIMLPALTYYFVLASSRPERLPDSFWQSPLIFGRGR